VGVGCSLVLLRTAPVSTAAAGSSSSSRCLNCRGSLLSARGMDCGIFMDTQTRHHPARHCELLGVVAHYSSGIVHLLPHVALTILPPPPCPLLLPPLLRTPPPSQVDL